MNTLPSGWDIVLDQTRTIRISPATSGVDSAQRNESSRIHYDSMPESGSLADCVLRPGRGGLRDRPPISKRLAVTGIEERQQR